MFDLGGVLDDAVVRSDKDDATAIGYGIADGSMDTVHGVLVDVLAKIA